MGETVSHPPTLCNLVVVGEGGDMVGRERLEYVSVIPINPSMGGTCYLTNPHLSDLPLQGRLCPENEADR